MILAKGLVLGVVAGAVGETKVLYWRTSGNKGGDRTPGDNRIGHAPSICLAADSARQQGESRLVVAVLSAS